MNTSFKKLIRDDRGAALVEYGALIALILAIAVGTVTSIGTKVEAAFTTVNGALP